MSNNREIQVKVFRYYPEKTEENNSEYKTYSVPFEEGFQVLDILQYIKDNYDSSFAFRLSCGYSKCGSCGIEVNGIPCSACWKRAKTEMIIAPMFSFPILKDLVINRSEYDKIIDDSLPVFEREESLEVEEVLEYMTSEQADRLSEIGELRNCIRCLVCVDACPAFEYDPGDGYLFTEDFYGPFPFIKHSIIWKDPRNINNKGGIQAANKSGLWNCTGCMLCEEVCPHDINPGDEIIDLRAGVMEEPDPDIQVHFKVADLNLNVRNVDNPIGLPRRERTNWIKEIDTDVPTSGKHEALLWIGCLPSYVDRQQDTAKSIISVFDYLDIDFMILGDDEVCCGEHSRQTGERGQFNQSREKIIDLLKTRDFENVVTISPHCYDVLSDLEDVQDKDVFHYTQFISRELEKRKTQITNPINEDVIYHDPCYLGRLNNVYDPPRNILREILKTDLIEFDRNRRYSNCCGGGGGGYWVDESSNRRMSERRINEAISKERKPKTIAVACPFCHEMLADSIDRLGYNDIKVTQVIQLLERALDLEKI